MDSIAFIRSQETLLCIVISPLIFRGFNNMKSTRPVRTNHSLLKVFKDNLRFSDNVKIDDAGIRYSLHPCFDSIQNLKCCGYR